MLQALKNISNFFCFVFDDLEFIFFTIVSDAIGWVMAVENFFFILSQFLGPIPCGFTADRLGAAFFVCPLGYYAKQYILL